MNCPAAEQRGFNRNIIAPRRGELNTVRRICGGLSASGGFKEVCTLKGV